MGGGRPHPGAVTCEDATNLVAEPLARPRLILDVAVAVTIAVPVDPGERSGDLVPSPQNERVLAGEAPVLGEEDQPKRRRVGCAVVGPTLSGSRCIFFASDSESDATVATTVALSPPAVFATATSRSSSRARTRWFADQLRRAQRAGQFKVWPVRKAAVAQARRPAARSSPASVHGSALPSKIGRARPSPRRARAAIQAASIVGGRRAR